MKPEKYREVDISQCGDDTTAESYDQRPVGHQHELCRSSHRNASSKSGVLDVNLRDRNRKMYHVLITEEILCISLVYIYKMRR